MNLQKVFSIIVVTMCASLIVTNTGCSSLSQKEAIKSKPAFCAKAYRAAITSSYRAELPDLIDAAIKKHTADDVANIKKVVADEKLIAALYADLDKQFKTFKFKGDNGINSYYHFLNSDETLNAKVVAVLCEANPAITRNDLNAALANKELVDEIKSLLTTEQVSASDMLKTLVKKNPHLAYALFNAAFSKDKEAVQGATAELATLATEENITTLSTIATKYKKNTLNYAKSTSDLSTYALIFYAARHYNTMNDADLEARVKENIAAKTYALYLVAAEKQKNLNIILMLLEDCASRRQLIEELKKSRKITPFRANIELERYNEMEAIAEKLAGEFKTASFMLSQYTGVDAQDEAFFLIDDSILNKNAPKLISQSELANYEKMAMVCRKELAFLNNGQILNVADYKNAFNKFNGGKAFLNSAHDLIEFQTTPARYDLYFYPDKMELNKRAPLAMNILSSLHTAYQAAVADNRYEQNIADMKQAEKEYIAFVAQNSDSALKDLDHLSTIENKSLSDLTILKLDELRFNLTKKEIASMESLSRYYDAWVMLINSVGTANLMNGNLNAAVKNLNKSYTDTVAEFNKNKKSEAPAEVSPDVIPTVRFIDVDYIDSYKK